MAEKMIAENQLDQLEKSLRAKLAPIEPNEQFIGSLRRRLEDSPTYQKKQRLAVSLLSVALGLTVGLAVFLIGRGLVNEAEKV
jgi:type VI protein secretion system component VasF